MTHYEVIPCWTVRDTESGRIGCGRIPWTTKDEAQAWANKENARLMAIEKESLLLDAEKDAEDRGPL